MVVTVSRTFLARRTNGQQPCDGGMERLEKSTASTSAVGEPRERRYEELRRTLEDRRRELDTSIRDRLSVVREERAASEQVRCT